MKGFAARCTNKKLKAMTSIMSDCQAPEFPCRASFTETMFYSLVKCLPFKNSTICLQRKPDIYLWMLDKLMPLRSNTGERNRLLLGESKCIYKIKTWKKKSVSRCIANGNVCKA